MILHYYETMATSPSLLSPPNVYGNPFIGLTPLNEFDFQTFIGHLLRLASDTKLYMQDKRMTTVYTYYGYTYPLIDMLPSLALRRNVKLAENLENTLFRAIRTLVANTDLRGGISNVVEYVKDIDGSTVKIEGSELWGTLLLIYFSTGRPMKYFPMADLQGTFSEDNTTGRVVEEGDWSLILGVSDSQPAISAVKFRGSYEYVLYVSNSASLELIEGSSKQKRKNLSSTTDILFNQKGVALRHLKVYTDIALSIDLAGYQWSMKNILKSLKGGFTDSTVTLSYNSKTYNVDRTVLGMFSGYFNTAFKTSVGTSANINVAYKSEFEQYLAYLSGQSNSILDTSEFFNHFSFARAITDDYLALALIRQLGNDIANLNISLDEIQKIDKMVGDYVSVIQL